jgi:hypothetical protein
VLCIVTFVARCVAVATVLLIKRFAKAVASVVAFICRSVRPVSVTFRCVFTALRVVVANRRVQAPVVFVVGGVWKVLIVVGGVAWRGLKRVLKGVAEARARRAEAAALANQRVETRRRLAYPTGDAVKSGEAAVKDVDAAAESEKSTE